MLRQRICDEMIGVHRISLELADRHVAKMDHSQLRRRLRHYARVGFAVAVGARPPEIRLAADPDGRDGGPSKLALSTRQQCVPPQGGGGGGFDLAVGGSRRAEKQVCSGGCRVPGL
jgi:hypothetical protein